MLINFIFKKKSNCNIVVTLLYYLYSLINMFNNILLSLPIVFTYYFIFIDLFIDLLNLIYLLLRISFLHFIVKKHISSLFYC